MPTRRAPQNPRSAGPRGPGAVVARRGQRGQALLEFALIAVLMLSLAFGVVEFGRAFHAALTVSHAARDGARVGMDPEADDAAIIAAVEAAAAPLDVEPPAIDRATGGQVEVTVTYEFETAAPFISQIWGGGSLTISRTMIGRIEG